MSSADGPAGTAGMHKLLAVLLVKASSGTRVILYFDKPVVLHQAENMMASGLPMGCTFLNGYFQTSCWSVGAAGSAQS